MRIRTSRTAPGTIESPDYAFSSFKSGKPFPEKKTGRLPAMGWNSWNAFGSGNTEALTLAMAEKMVELGLDKLGYKYLILDDGCYCPERRERKLVNEPVKFPSGFRALADAIHAKGLKFGMYNDIGTRLCAGAWVGTCGFEDVDARTYVDWGVDFLKVDNCYYLWDNATFSDGTNARFTYAPKIKGIKLCPAVDTDSEAGSCCDDTAKGSDCCCSLESISPDSCICLDAARGTLTGCGGRLEDGVVSFIGTFDGTNVGTTPVGDMSSELQFTVDATVSGEYTLYVTYASAKEPGQGEWLQVAVGDIENEIRYFDGLLPETPDKDSFSESPAIPLKLSAGRNVLRLMNHRRQENTLDSYAAMFYALQAAKPGNDIILSLCEWGKTQPQNWAYKMGNSWRILNDICFSVGSDGNLGTGSWNDPGTQSICSQYNKCVVMDEFSGLQKGYNDPDMMVIGMEGITETMSRTHMAMWCMMNSPLMLGLDLRRVETGDAIWSIVTDTDLIALNQDPLGIQAKRVFCTLEEAAPDTTYITNNDRVDILAKPLANGDVAISFINLSTEWAEEGYSISMEKIIEKLGGKVVNRDELAAAKAFMVYDLEEKETRFKNGTTFSVSELAPCGSVTLRVTPLE